MQHTEALKAGNSFSQQSVGVGAKTAFRLEDRSTLLKGVKVWSLVFDLPDSSVNKLDTQVMEEFPKILSQLESLNQAGKLDAVLMVSGKPGNFMAGADIKMFETFKTPADAEALCHKGHEIFNRWEDLPFPKVVGINGVALGGGCELSLASDAIVMSDHPKAKIGLPEVLLGVIPGLGGCVRLPRKVGIASALDMILTGKQVDGNKAFKMGLAEACLPKEDFESSALKWMAKNLSALKRKKRLARKPKQANMGGMLGALIEGPLFRSLVVYNQARQGILKATKGHAHYPAPLEALDVVRDTFCGYGPKLRGAKRTQALQREAKGFGKCASTDVSRNLIRIFFLTEEVKKSNGLKPGNDVEAKTVNYAGVLGAGIMGGGIAQLLADKDIPARMKDVNKAGLETGLHSAAQIFKKKLQRRRLNHRQYNQKMNLISPVLNYDGFGGLDVVVEAVIEKMEIKKAVFKELESHISDDCVVASNTSSLSVSEMQTAFQKPQRFLGMHFFNPVHRMPLVEVIRGSQTSDEAVATIYNFAKALGKTPIVVKDGAGFLVNRLLVPYMNEAIHLLAEGVPMEELDKALIRFGMPMGPLELVDEVGVDTGEKVLNILHQAFGARMKPLEGMEKITAAKRYGKKNGLGIYKYEGKGDRPKKQVDVETYRLLGVQPKPKKMDEKSMVERCVFPMINEAARCLEEQVVARPEDVDLGMIFGTGFAPFRGGLLRYADSAGLKYVVERLGVFAKEVNAQRFEVAPALLQRVSRGQNFYG